MSHNTSAIQTLSATVIVSGPQLIKIDTHGTGGRGSYISVSTPHLMITIHDLPAARTYADIWKDASLSAVYLPPSRSIEVKRMAERMPGVVVSAYGKDHARAVYASNRGELRVYIGYLTFVVTDKEAFESFANAWRSVRQLAPLVLPR